MKISEAKTEFPETVGLLKEEGWCNCLKTRLIMLQVQNEDICRMHA
jgi:hypothetical protein